MYILFKTNEAWELIKNNDQLLSNCYKHFKIPFEIQILIYHVIHDEEKRYILANIEMIRVNLYTKIMKK